LKELRHSTCPLDCPDACSLLVTVEDGRATALRGNPAHPITQGFLCAKVARYLEREYHPGRLQFPLRRIGPKGEGQFTRITWDEALEEIVARWKALAAQYGPESVLPYSYAGTMGYLQGSGMDRRFFHRFGASRLDRTICSSAGGVGWTAAYGARFGTAPQDFAHSKLIIAWGANILTTNVHLWPFIVEARRRGARLVVIDPVTTKVARLADKHLAPYPGSDLALALGLMHVILRDGLEDRDYIAHHTTGIESLRSRAAEFPPERAAELTGIPVGEIEQLAHDYAATRPACIRLNYGVQRSERGSAAVQAISLLPALIGSWKQQGGGAQLTTSGAFEINRSALERPDLQQIALGREARVLNMSLLGRVLTEPASPPVQSLCVYNSNPAAIAPNQGLVLKGLAREDLFTVVIDHFQTDTADRADIVLPATTFLEHTDLYFAYGHYSIQFARPVLAPPGEAKSNCDIFRELARRMGFEEPCLRDSDEEMVRQTLDSGSPHLAGVTLERLENEHFVPLNVPKLPFSEGSCNLDATKLDYRPPVESRLGEGRTQFPLELVSSKAHDALNSSFGFRAEVDEQTGVLEMHPADAAPRGIANGNTVEVFNARGSLRLTARVGDGVRAGVVRAPMVRWNKRSPEKRNANVLISDRLTDAGGGPTFYNCLVEVRLCAS
jgi:anaerobic selenocysteine-containing dehydrogenase